LLHRRPNALCPSFPPIIAPAALSLLLTLPDRPLFVSLPLSILILFSLRPLPPDPEDPTRLTGKTRKVGMCVCRGTAVFLVAPMEGSGPIDNPFV
jgi:hypothetical protein